MQLPLPSWTAGHNGHKVCGVLLLVGANASTVKMRGLFSNGALRIGARNWFPVQGQLP
jgi:hypothetical protein